MFIWNSKQQFCITLQTTLLYYMYITNGIFVLHYKHCFCITLQVTFLYYILYISNGVFVLHYKLNFCIIKITNCILVLHFNMDLCKDVVNLFNCGRYWYNYKWLIQHDCRWPYHTYNFTVFTNKYIIIYIPPWYLLSLF